MHAYCLARQVLLTSELPVKVFCHSAAAEVGDESCIPDLASCLHDPELNPPATDALWAVFHRHPNPEVKALMDQGLALLHPGTPLVRLRSALQVYEEACRLEPSYAEVSGWWWGLCSGAEWCRRGGVTRGQWQAVLVKVYEHASRLEASHAEVVGCHALSPSSQSFSLIAHCFYCC